MPTTVLTPGERVSRKVLLAFGVLVALFLGLPMLVIFPLALSDGEFLVYPIRGYSWRWFEVLFSSEKWLRALRNSVVIGFASATIATVLGTMAAIGLARARFRGKAVLTGLILSPLVVPAVTYSVGLYFFFSPLGLTESFTGIVLAHAALGAPFVVVTVGASLAGFDHNLMRAAASLGAPPLLAFRRVMLPLVLPGVVTGALFALAASFDEVITVIFLAGPGQSTLPRELFAGLRESISPVIASASVVIILTTMLLLVVADRMKRLSAR